MRTKNVAMIIGAVAVIAIIAGVLYFTVFSGPEYKNITMNGVSMEVPESNSTVQNNSSCFSTYNDSEHGIMILTFDSEGMGLNDLGEAAIFAGIRDASQVGGTNITKDNYTYSYSEKQEIYSYVTNFTHKNVLVLTKNEDDLMHILQTMKLNETIEQNDTNDTDNATVNSSTTKKTRSSKSSSKSSSSADEPDYMAEDDGEYDEIILPGTDGQSAKARYTGSYEDYGSRYVTEDGEVVYV